MNAEAADRLALEGGLPVRTAMLPYGHQWVDEEDIRAVAEALRSDWLTTGPKVAEFEQAFAARVGAKHAVAFSSGTAALHGAAHVAGLGPADEAITTPLTFAASANCVLYCGATPRFADIDPATLTIDPAAIEAALSPATKLIIPVDYAGQPHDVEAVRAIADRRGLKVITDASHALGAIYRGRRVGSLADFTVFSLHPVKHITTGEGGMVTTEDSSAAGQLRRFRTHGIESNETMRAEHGGWYYEMTGLGYNYRLPDLNCALGLSQLRRLDASLARREAIAARYRPAFADQPEVQLPALRPDVRHAYHLFVILLRLDRLSAGRAATFRALRAENIGVQVHYIPVHLHPYYRARFGYRPGEFPRAEAAYESLLTLPLFPAMSDGDVEDVIRAVKKVLAHYRRS